MNSFRFLQRGVEAELERQRELIGAGGTVDPGDAPLRPVERQPHLAALEGGGARLPLLPRARPGAAGADRADAARGPRGAAGAAGGADRALRERAGAGRATSPPASPPIPRPPPTSRAPRTPPAGVEPKVVANWVTGELAAALRQGDEEVTAADSKVEPDALAALIAMVQEKKISHGSGKTVLAALVAEGGDPAAIVEREGLAQMSSDGGELEAIVAAAVEANPEAAEQIRAGNGEGDRRDRRRGDEGDQGPRRRRRGQPPDPGATRAQ